MTKFLERAGWIPIRLYWDQGRPSVDWCYLGTRRFREPFFTQTVEQCLRQPFNLAFRPQTPVEVLADRQARRPGLAPTGFLFHMSRCGSTLVSQMLAALPRNIVLSEAGPLDDVLRANVRDPRVTDEQRIAWLRGMVSALGQRRAGEDRLFVKFDAWHTLYLPLIQAAFPGVPWVFLYRDPVEVLVSQCRQPASYLIPGVLGPLFPCLDRAAADQAGVEEYAARILASICQAALDWQERTGSGLLVNYTQLPEAVWSAVAEFWGTTYSPEDRERMRQVTQFDAKTPSLYFTDDTAEKQRQATDPLRRAADTWLGPVYERLEARRQAATTGPSLRGDSGEKRP
jgi:hypothetical protein